MFERIQINISNVLIDLQLLPLLGELAALIGKFTNTNISTCTLKPLYNELEKFIYGILRSLS